LVKLGLLVAVEAFGFELATGALIDCSEPKKNGQAAASTAHPGKEAPNHGGPNRKPDGETEHKLSHQPITPTTFLAQPSQIHQVGLTKRVVKIFGAEQLVTSN
jgi:hypothetical protein